MNIAKCLRRDFSKNTSGGCFCINLSCQISIMEPFVNSFCKKLKHKYLMFNFPSIGSFPLNSIKSFLNSKSILQYRCICFRIFSLIILKTTSFGFFFRGKVSAFDICGTNSLCSMSHKDYVTFYIIEQPRPQSNF